MIKRRWIGVDGGRDLLPRSDLIRLSWFNRTEDVFEERVTLQSVPAEKCFIDIHCMTLRYRMILWQTANIRELVIKNADHQLTQLRQAFHFRSVIRTYTLRWSSTIRKPLSANDRNSSIKLRSWQIPKEKSRIQKPITYYTSETIRE